MEIKKLFFVVGAIWFAGDAKGQSIPTAIVLYPNNITVSGDLMEELGAYEKTFEITEEIRSSFVDPALPEHWQRNRAMTLEFMKEQDFFSLLTKTTVDQLTYLLLDFHEVIVNFPVKEVCPPDLKNYRLLADKHEVAWIVNYTAVELAAEDGAVTLKARIQLYNKPSNIIWINKEYTSLSNNGAIECISGIAEQCTQEIFDMIEEKRHYWSM